jgi:hypothetical protein
MVISPDSPNKGSPAGCIKQSAPIPVCEEKKKVGDSEDGASSNIKLMLMHQLLTQTDRL